MLFPPIGGLIYPPLDNRVWGICAYPYCVYKGGLICPPWTFAYSIYHIGIGYMRIP